MAIFHPLDGIGFGTGKWGVLVRAAELGLKQVKVWKKNGGIAIVELGKELMTIDNGTVYSIAKNIENIKEF